MPTPQESLAVTVMTDKRAYRRGEPILVTIRNDLSTAICAFIGEHHCSVISVQRQEADQWETDHACTASDAAFFITVAPQSELQGTLGHPAHEVSPPGPMVSKPSIPATSKQDLRTLPPAKPWKPGEPTYEMPDKRHPSRDKGRPSSTTDRELGAGTYRIAFHFKVGTPPEPTRIAYSETFVVSE